MVALTTISHAHTKGISEMLCPNSGAATFGGSLHYNGATRLSHFEGPLQMLPSISEQQRIQPVDHSWPKLSQDSLRVGEDEFSLTVAN